MQTKPLADACAWCEAPVAPDHVIHRPGTIEPEEPEPIFCSFLHLGYWLRERTSRAGRR